MTAAQSGVSSRVKNGSVAVHHRRRLVLATVLLGQFLTVGAMGTMNVALPAIRDDLHASPSAIQWVIVLYQLPYASVLVTGGRLGDIFGRKRMFLVGLAGFVVASALAAGAPSTGVLIAARVLQGMFGGLTSPQILAMIQVAFPPPERARALAAFGGVSASAFMVGQFMSGVLLRVDPLSLSWRAPFVATVAFGAAALLIAARVLPTTGATHRHELDGAGILLLSAGGLLVLYPLIQGRAAGWPSGYFLMLGASVVVVAVFLRVERRLTERAGEPLIDVRLFGARSFTGGLLVSVAFSLSAFPIFYVLTLTLQLGFGFDPLETALATAATPLVVIPMSSVSARLLPRFGRRIVPAAATFGMLASLALLATLEWAPRPLSPFHLIPALVLLGCNNGLGMTATVNLTLVDVPAQHAGAASGIYQMAQQGASAVGVALAGIVFFGTLGAADSVAAYTSAMQWTMLVTIGTSALAFALHPLLPPVAPRRADLADEIELSSDGLLPSLASENPT